MDMVEAWWGTHPWKDFSFKTLNYPQVIDFQGKNLYSQCTSQGTTSMFRHSNIDLHTTPLHGRCFLVKRHCHLENKIFGFKSKIENKVYQV